MIESAPIEEPFFSAKLRLARANEHLDKPEAEIVKFFAENKSTRVSELDPDGIHTVHKIRFERFPAEWNLLATEIIEHMRASLDHAVYATRTLNQTDLATFPFAKSAADLANRVKGAAKDTPPEIQTLLRSFNCYRGGNDFMHALNDLCNASKHGLIVLVAGAIFSGEISGSGASWAGGVQIFDPVVWDTSNNEIKYARSRGSVDLEHQVKLEVYVALKDIEGLSHEPATAIFAAMSNQCAQAIGDIERTFNALPA
jgi:hypothetical protein